MRHSSTTIALAVDALTVRYGRRRVIDGISFQWDDGALGVTGANGSGKSTLLRAIVGSVRVAGGDIHMTRGGHPLRRSDVTIGFVPQSFDFAGGMTVRDFVEYAAWLRQVESRRKAAERVISEVGLEAQRSARMSTLSGGMVRRAGLAAALVGSPQLLVLDEPTTGIDPEQRAIIRQLLHDQAQKRAIIVSSHIAEDLEQVCRSVLILDSGRIAFHGSPDDAKREARTDSFEAAIVALPKSRRVVG